MTPRLFLLAAALLGGCSLAPEYQRPAAPVAAVWPADAPDAAGTREAHKTHWKSFFPDPRLQALIEAALANNSDLKIAIARVEQARGEAGIASANQLPGVNLAWSRTASRTPADLTLGRPAQSNRYDFGLSLTNFEVDFWGRVHDASEAARAAYLASAAAQRAFRIGLIADVAGAYLSFLEATERADIAEKSLATRAQTRELVARRREVGLASDMDYLQADGAHQIARADLANQERTRAAAAHALTWLTGVPADKLPVGGAGRALAEQGIVADIRAGIPTEVLLRRPDVQSAEQRLIAANLNVGVARAAFLPKLLLTASGGTASAALAGLFMPGSTAWSAQPALTIQALSYFTVGPATERAAEAQKQQAAADYQKTLQTAFREVADLLSAREQNTAQLAAFEQAARAQAERLQLVRAREDAGASSALETLDAQRDAYTAQQNLIAARRALYTTAAQFYKALGGGEE